MRGMSIGMLVMKNFTEMTLKQINKGRKIVNHVAFNCFLYHRCLYKPQLPKIYGRK